MEGGDLHLIKLHLSRLLGERKMSQAELAQMTGIRPNTIGDLYHERTVRVRVDHLDRICAALDCELDELIVRTPRDSSKN